jgi:HlyD family secretion protein
VVPIQALVVREAERNPPGDPRDEEGVYLMEQGKARFQPIKTGLLGELDLEVLAGLKGGETILTGPFKALRALKPGDLVRVEKK